MAGSQGGPTSEAGLLRAATAAARQAPEPDAEAKRRLRPTVGGYVAVDRDAIDTFCAVHGLSLEAQAVLLRLVLFANRRTGERIGWSLGELADRIGCRRQRLPKVLDELGAAEAIEHTFARGRPGGFRVLIYTELVALTADDEAAVDAHHATTLVRFRAQAPGQTQPATDGPPADLGRESEPSTRADAFSLSRTEAAADGMEADTQPAAAAAGGLPPAPPESSPDGADDASEDGEAAAPTADPLPGRVVDPPAAGAPPVVAGTPDPLAAGLDLADENRASLSSAPTATGATPEDDPDEPEPAGAGKAEGAPLGMWTTNARPSSPWAVAR